MRHLYVPLRGAAPMSLSPKTTSGRVARSPTPDIPCSYSVVAKAQIALNSGILITSGVESAFARNKECHKTLTQLDNALLWTFDGGNPARHEREGTC